VPAKTTANINSAIGRAIGKNYFITAFIKAIILTVNLITIMAGLNPLA
jgi:hypothetical protein